MSLRPPWKPAPQLILLRSLPTGLRSGNVTRWPNLPRVAQAWRCRSGKKMEEKKVAKRRSPAGEREPAAEVKSGQVKWFQATEGEMQAAMARNESDGGPLSECQAGTHHNRWY
ncbi:unnamed protein product [Pleuronectes platessa]|uniref:Uncharacterized protein n=1 Tax=Pleuronectes platessa TaxID=8262 RepID=A0A9N7Z0N7_PLEPL|nr:unnamed protein product [Pleuronectes platessa]